MASMADSTGLTDEEFRTKLENHFAMYRMNLRSPLVQHISMDQWYRVEVFIVNEIGLFKRADIEPDGRVDLGCELLVPASADSMTPLKQDTTYDLTIRPSTWLGADTTSLPNTGVAGFLASGKGSFEYSITPKTHSQQKYQRGPRYLRIYGQHVERFPQQQAHQPSKLDDWILPLVVGPIELLGDGMADTNMNTNASIECWPPTTPMVHSSYRLFSTTSDVGDNSSSSNSNDNNVAIHESWESGIPGKIWDSALVMLQMLERMVQYKPDSLNGKHVLDLSAG